MSKLRILGDGRPTLVGVGVAVSALLLSASAAAASPVSSRGSTDVNIRFASSVPTATATGQAVTRIATALNKNLKMNVQSFLNSTLYTQGQLPQALQTGAVDIAVTASDAFSTLEPALALQDIPLLWDNAAEAEKAVEGPLKSEFTKLFAKHGIVYIGGLLYGPANTIGTLSKQVKTPADLRGLKIRSYNPLISAMLQSYGAAPVVIDSAEVYTAIQRGTIDGAFSASGSFTSTGWDQVIKYATEVPLYYAIYPVMANAKWWSSLTAQQQKQITRVVHSAAVGVPALLQMVDSQSVSKMQSEGVTITKISGKALNIWKKPISSVYAQYYSQGGAEARTLVKLAQTPSIVGPTATLAAKTKAYGSYCRAESKKGAGSSPFAQCVKAMALLASYTVKSPTVACKPLRTGKAAKVSKAAYSLCITAAKKLPKSGS